MGDLVRLPRLADSAVGCDRLSLSFRLEHFDPTAFSQMSASGRVDGTVGVDSFLHVVKGDPEQGYGGAAVTLGARQVAGKWFGKVEANPSRFVDPGGCSLLPLREIPLAVEAMAAVAEQHDMVAATDLHEWRVKRIDVARDFRGVSVPRFYVDGLERLRRTYNKRTGKWSDAECGDAQTLHVGSGAGMVRLYDQHAAYAGKGAPEGSLRWECEARRGWLDRHAVRVVSDLSVGRCEDLAADRWEWSRMGTRVTGTVGVVDAVDRLVRAGGFADRLTGQWRAVSQVKADRMLGQLLRESLGASAHMSNDARAEYERLKRHLGVVPTAQLFEGGNVSVAGRLQFDEGTEALEDVA